MVPAYVIRPAAVFHAFTRFYDFGCAILGFGRRFKRTQAKLADVLPAHRVLDVACGTGILSEELDLLGAHVVGVDPDPGALRIAATRVRRLVLARGEALPFATGAFDRVVCTLAFHHVPDLHKGTFLEEVLRVLSADGKFLLVDFDNHRRWWVPRWFRSIRRLGEWVEHAGFVVTDLGRCRLAHRYLCRSPAR